MVMIYNPAIDEWDNQGIGSNFHHLRRWAWDKLAQAKCHIAGVLDAYCRTTIFDSIVEWYLNAEFIQETIPGDRIELLHTPCAGYVRRWLADRERMIRRGATPDVVSYIEKLGVWQED